MATEGTATEEEIDALQAQLDSQKRMLLSLIQEYSEYKKKMLEKTREQLQADRDIAEQESEVVQIGKKRRKMEIRARKQERSVEEMTHDERVKELAAKARNFSTLVINAEDETSPDAKRTKELTSAIIAREQKEYEEEEEEEKVLEEMKDIISQIKTDPAETKKLTPQQREDNLRQWAQLHACMRKLEVLRSDKTLTSGEIEHLRHELIPLMEKEKTTGDKIKRAAAWLRDVEDQQRKLLEEDEQQEELKKAA